MTRLERIKFIRENCPLYANENFADYDDDDVFNLYFRIPLSKEKQKKRDDEFKVWNWWFGVLEKMPPILDENADWNFPKNIIASIWILFFNPIVLPLYFILSIVFTLLYFFH